MKPLYRLLLLIALGVSAYSNAIFLPFVHDDIVFIQQNTQIGKIGDIATAFFPEASSLDSAITNRYYRPLLEVFYRFEHLLFGFNPAGYHLINVLLHLVNGFLILKLLEGVGLSSLLAWLVAAFFLVHPVQTEAVTCVSGISNLLSAFFILLSLIAFDLIGKPGIRNRAQGWAAGGLFYVLALLTKESSVVLLGLLVLVEAQKIFLRKFSDPNSKTTAPLAKKKLLVALAITGLYFVWRSLILPHAAILPLGTGSDLVLRLAAIPHAVVMYFRILVFPYDLHYYRNLDILAPLGYYPLVLGLIVLGGFLGVRRLKAGPAIWAGFGISWFLIAILPTLNIIPLVNEYSQIAAFEHFLYLPSFGFFIFILVVGDQILTNALGAGAPKIKFLICGTLLGLCLGGSLQQNQYWRSEIALFERMARFEPNFGRGYQLLGEAYLVNKDYDLAIVSLKKALRIFRFYEQRVGQEHPRKFYQIFIKSVCEGLAYGYEQKGELGQALSYYLEAEKLSPQDSDLLNRVGLCYVRQGQFALAASYFEKSVECNPQNPQALNNLAISDIQQGKKKQAKALLEQTLRLAPDFPSVQKNLENLRKEVP